MEDKTYFSVSNINWETYDKEHIQIREFEQMKFACQHPRTELIVEKEFLGGRKSPWGNFQYPYVYSYKIYDKDQTPYFLSVGEGEITKYMFETYTSGYNGDEGFAIFSLVDRYQSVEEVKIKTGFNIGLAFLLNLYEFMHQFKGQFNCDFRNYKLGEEIEELKKSHETEIRGLQYEIEELKEKLEKTKKTKKSMYKG